MSRLAAVAIDGYEFFLPMAPNPHPGATPPAPSPVPLDAAAVRLHHAETGL